MADRDKAGGQGLRAREPMARRRHEREGARVGGASGPHGSAGDSRGARRELAGAGHRRGMASKGTGGEESHEGM